MIKKKSDKLPAMQVYPGDWRKDPGVQALDYFDRGVWWEMLCLMHESSDRGKLLLNGRAMPEDALSRMLGLDKQILTKTLTNLLEYGVASLDSRTGCIVSRRMVRDEEIRRIRKNCGKLGGNPHLLVNQKSTTQDKLFPTPSSSSSSSSSEEKIINTIGVNLTGLKLAFEAARKCYGGDKRGGDPEWKNFLAKHRARADTIVPLLQPAIERERAHKEKLKAAGAFSPPWKNFQTWINQSCWTMEFGEATGNSKVTRTPMPESDLAIPFTGNPNSPFI